MENEKQILKLAAQLLKEHSRSLSNNGCNDPTSEVEGIINSFEGGAFQKILEDWAGEECIGCRNFDWIIADAVADKLNELSEI